MTFDLSEELNDSIITAMENQETQFAVDAANNQLIALTDSQDLVPDEENVYTLPEWGPADGFTLREAFVKNLHSPLAHDELQSVLHSGRGVFKNFRNVLKDYPEVEKRWHIFKHKYMSGIINEWYNSLREVWGLESLEQLPEPEESLIYDDFSLRNYSPADDSEVVISNICAASCDDEQNLPADLQTVFKEIWKKQFIHADSIGQFGFICQSYSEEFAGVITASSLLEKQKQTYIITSLFVSEQFRGMGICSELLSKCISELQGNGSNWIIIPNIFAPESIQPLLTRTGFIKTNSGYLLKLGD